jgi:hypothetical protein
MMHIKEHNFVPLPVPFPSKALEQEQAGHGRLRGSRHERFLVDVREAGMKEEVNTADSDSARSSPGNVGSRTVATDGTALVEGLLRSEAYPWRPAAVELIETHVSWVFLAADRVVKVKKPVSYGFVDHTTLKSRHRSCADEVRLNRRLTDGVYLEVVPIVRDRTGYRVAVEGVPVEWATLMRRLPKEGMLDALVAAGAIPCAWASDSLIAWSRSIAT